jgi:hypothetical protein
VCLAKGSDRSAIWSLGAGQYLDERGLAGAVFTDQAMNLAGSQVKIDFIERDGVAEFLAQVVDRQNVAAAALLHRVVILWSFVREMSAQFREILLRQLNPNRIVLPWDNFGFVQNRIFGHRDDRKHNLLIQFLGFAGYILVHG